MKVGDRVEAVDDDIIGQISDIKGDEITIITSEGFEMLYNRSELIPSLGYEVQDIALEPDLAEKIKEDLQPRKRKKAISPKRKEQPPMEVDLHIGKLVDSTRGLTNFDILNIQLETAKRQVEFAIRKRIRRIVFIHGVGEGVLRSELETLLNRYDNLKFYDADYRKYGVGATEVYFYQNPRP